MREKSKDSIMSSRGAEDIISELIDPYHPSIRQNTIPKPSMDENNDYNQSAFTYLKNNRRGSGS